LRAWRASALSLVVLGLSAPAASAISDPGAVSHDELDARAGDRAAVPAATAEARTALDRSLGLQGTVSADPVTGGLREVGRTDGFLTAPSASDPATVGLGYVRDHRDAFGLDGADLSQLRLATSSVSSDGVTHLTWRQVVGGVPAYDSALFANVTADGRLVNAGGAPVHDLQVPSTDPPLGPSAARGAAQRDLDVAVDGDPGSVGTDPVRTTRFADGDSASLVTLAGPDGDHLAWKLIVAGKNPYIYEVLVDAASGAILHRASMTEFATSASVFKYHPGAAAGGTATSVTFPSGWLPSSPTSLTGPNAHAYADRNDPDGIGTSGDVDVETAPNPSTTNFNYTVTSQSSAAFTAGHSCPTAFTTPCTWDGAYTFDINDTAIPTPGNASVTANQSQATTQLFYYVNNYHDWLAADPINFTTSSHNFQGDDPVNAEADDFGGLNNANMSTPPDGSSPTMQMYLFTGGASHPAVNGADDASVVYHEYTHGMTNRLVGGDGQANGLQTRQSRAMGEAWSDWYAMDYLNAQGFVPDDPSTNGDVVVGEYVTNNVDTGIRDNALDCPVGSGPPRCPGSATAGPGGFTFADMGRVSSSGGNPFFEVHADGEIWAETLWDLRTAVGATIARGLVTSALRLSPKQPSFLDMRDAILQADSVTGGSHRAAIWQVFAHRGMGFGATTTSGNAGRGTVSFATPPLAATGKPDVQSPVPLGDGDAALEPGEAARVRIPIVNPGTTALTNVRATLTASTAGVVVGTSKATYGTIAAGATGAAAAPFAITVQTSVPCATTLALTVTVTSDQGTMLTAPVSLPTGGGSSVATATGLPQAIPDGSRSTGLTSSLTIAGAGRVGHLRVTVSVSHTYVGDLHGTLTSPAGTTVNLFEEVGVGGLTDADGFSGVVLDDDAPTSIQDVPTVSFPANAPAITGTYSPDEPLAALADESRAGVWKLRVFDDYSVDTGSLTAWSLSTDQLTCAATGRSLPSASTGAAIAQTDTSALLTGSATDSDSGAFEYGTTTDYGTVVPASSHSDDGATSVSIGGLAPGTTYHYRVLALRAGTVMALGADQSFVAGAPPPPPPSLAPPAVPSAPTTIPITKLPTSVTVDSKSRFTFKFSVPSGTAKSGVTGGTVTLKSAKALRVGKSKKKTIFTAGSARFTVPANGKITFRVTLSKTARTYLRTHRGIAVKATIKLGKTTKTVALTIKAAKKTKA
jgi:subtilisin-like proprotein convertase family protein